MSDLNIILPYQNAGKLWNVWALDEHLIDFRKDHFEAERCTLCFAALELKTFYGKADPDLKVSVLQKNPDNAPFVSLRVKADCDDDGFALHPADSGIEVVGNGRKGLLNGAYELLRLRGWRWFEPGPYGESAPLAKDFNWPKEEVKIIPSFKYRGYDAYRESNDSAQFLLWMARNRVNFSFRKAATAKLADKLGMFGRKGGHLLQRILAVDRLMASGRTIWEEHPEWYGVPREGKRTKANAMRTQFCVSNKELLNFLGEDILQALNGTMDGIDILDIWGFDTWGATCSCEKCKAIGNGADQNLYMLSFLREFLGKAQKDGRIERKTLLNIAAYEGTSTLEPPSKPVPENLCMAGDAIIYYPIRRCYKHLLDDDRCNCNKLYGDALRGWGRMSGGMSLWAGEYYNVSKFEDLPLLFTKLIPSDMRFYHACGSNGATYMHCIFTNWAMRSLTQLQHAQYAWDIDTNDKAFLDEYFQRKYDVYANEMRRVYDLIEEGLKDVSAWRSWGIGILDILLSWDGKVPAKGLPLPHFDNDESKAAKACHSGVALLKKAMKRLERVLGKEKVRNVEHLPPPGHVPVNPQEAEAIRYYDKYEYRLGEDRRMLIYGIDTLELTARILDYYAALSKRKFSKADEHWADIEAIADKMSTYFLPISFESPGPGIVCQDALTRSQLRKTITTCRGVRLKS